MPVTLTADDIAAIQRTLDPPAATIIGFSPTAGGSVHLLDCLRRGTVERPIHLINPRRAAAGETEYAASTQDIDGELGLVYVLLQGEAALAAIEGITSRPHGVVIFGGGFADEGRFDLEDRLRRWSMESFPGGRVPVLGPQSMGVFAPRTGFFGTNSAIPEEFIPGRMGFVSQSGGFLGNLARTVFSRKLGLAAAIAVGNGRATSVFDAAIALLDQDDVGVVTAYVEGVSDLQAFAALGAASREAGKPVLLAVGGLSDAGAAAARSHTGALATDERVLHGLARQFGLLIVASPEELVWGAEALLDNSVRRPAASEAAVMGFTGGGVIVVADELARNGVSLRAPSPATEARARAVLSSPRGILNPFDGGPAAGSRENVTEIIDAYTDDPLYGVYIYVAGAGLPTPTDNHQNQLQTIANAVVAKNQLGVVGSVVPDTASGEYTMPGVSVARGSHELAVKGRILRDWARASLNWSRDLVASDGAAHG